MGVAIFAAFFTTPLIIHSIDTKVYGYWLSTGELIGYIGCLDLGLLGLFPWLIAEADGKGDVLRIRWLMAQARKVTLIMSFVVIVIGGSGAFMLLNILTIDESIRNSILIPLLILVILLGTNYLLLPSYALLTGMQDATFLGVTNLVKSLLSLVLILGIIYNHGGLFALAWGIGLPPVVINTVLWIRARSRFKQLVIDCPIASFSSVKTLVKESIGPWIAGLGVTMIEKSQAVVLSCLGHPELSVVYASTAKLTQVLSNLCGIIIDSALVGVAQLSGEGKLDRKREVILILLNVQLVVSGLISVLILAINPAFVRLWLGNQYFGGIIFNAGLTALILVGGFAYTISKIVAVQGERLKIGKMTLKQGLCHLGLTFLFGWLFGLIGMVVGATLAVGLTTLQQGLVLLSSQVELSPLQILKASVLPWAARASPLLLLSLIVGNYTKLDSYLSIILVAAVISLFYLIAVRRCLLNLPVPSRFVNIFNRVIS